MSKPGNSAAQAERRQAAPPGHALPALELPAAAVPRFEDEAQRTLVSVCSAALARFVDERDWPAIERLLAEMQHHNLLADNFEGVAEWCHCVREYEAVREDCHDWDEAIVNFYDECSAHDRLAGRLAAACPPVHDALSAAWSHLLEDCCQRLFRQLSGARGAGRVSADERLGLFAPRVLRATSALLGLELPATVDAHELDGCAERALQAAASPGSVRGKLEQLRACALPPLDDIQAIRAEVDQISAAQEAVGTFEEILMALAPPAARGAAERLIKRLKTIAPRDAADTPEDLYELEETAAAWQQALLAIPGMDELDALPPSIADAFARASDSFPAAGRHGQMIAGWLTARRQYRAGLPKTKGGARVAAAAHQLVELYHGSLLALRCEIVAPLLAALAQRAAAAQGSSEARRQIFLSHATVNRELVQREIYSPLVEAGYDVFFTSDDRAISSRENFLRVIKRRLRSCDGFVVAVTHEALDKEWVEAEVSLAFTYEKDPLIVIRLDGVDPARLHPLAGLRQNIHYVDGEGQRTPQSLARGREKLLSNLREAWTPTEATAANDSNPAAALAEFNDALGQEMARLDVERRLTQMAHAAQRGGLAALATEFDEPAGKLLAPLCRSLGGVAEHVQGVEAAISPAGSLVEQWEPAALQVDADAVGSLAGAVEEAQRRLSSVDLPWLDDAGKLFPQLATIAASCGRVQAFRRVWSETKTCLDARDFSAAAEKAAELTAGDGTIHPLTAALRSMAEIRDAFTGRREEGDFDEAETQLIQLRGAGGALDPMCRQFLGNCCDELIETSAQQLQATRMAYQWLAEQALPLAAEGNYREALTVLDKVLARARDADEGFGCEGVTLPEINRWYEVIKALVELQDKLEGEQHEVAATAGR